MNFNAPVLLVGNGPTDVEAVALAHPHCRAVVAADGGLRAALAHGLHPEAVIGDMDSCPTGVRQMSDIKITEISAQDTTDFEKCLGTINAPLIIGLGFLGGRLDHELAALNALAQTPQNVVLVGDTDLVFRLPAFTRLSLPIGTRISTFPMGKVEIRVPIGRLRRVNAGRRNTRSVSPTSTTFCGVCASALSAASSWSSRPPRKPRPMISGALMVPRHFSKSVVSCADISVIFMSDICRTPVGQESISPITASGCKPWANAALRPPSAATTARQ